jgi:hypothetical protein
MTAPTPLTEYGWWHPAACTDLHDDQHNCIDARGSIIGWREESAYTDPNAVAARATDAELREAARDAYRTMDDACKWAAGQTGGIRSLSEADEHMRGYDALLDGTVRLGQALGILSRAALEKDR